MFLSFYLGKGITATMGRNGFFNMIYFGFYHSTKDLIPASTDPKLGITLIIHLIVIGLEL